VLDAVAGVQVVTEKVWDYATEYDVPRAFVINWMDRELANYDRAKRRADYVFVQERLARDVPFVVLSQRTEHNTVSDRVHGFDPGPIMDFWNPTELSIGP